MSPDQKQIDQICAWMRLFLEPGQVTELRSLEVQSGNWTANEAGFYDYEHLPEMSKAALEISERSVGVYFIPNPIEPSLLARCAYRLKRAKEGESVSDNHILRRNWFVIDADPSRVSKISSTDAEKESAWQLIQRAKEIVLHHHISKTLILADSGNGYHLACKIALPADDGGFVRLCLAGLAKRLDTAEVKVDQSLFNPSRIIKLYGTLSRKGDSTKERPHRRSSVIEVITP